MNKFLKYFFVTFKWFSYVIGVIAILIFLAFLSSYFQFNKSGIKSSKTLREDAPVPVATESSCVDKKEKNLLVTIKDCWAKKQQENLIVTINESIKSPQKNNAEIDGWLREKIENDTLFSNSERIRLTALNKILISTSNKNGYPRRSDDRNYLLSIINSGSENKATAIAMLGYYRDDTDISVFLESIKSNVDFDMVFSIESLINNCSPRAKEALKDALNLPNVKRYLEKDPRKELLTKDIEARCPLSDS